MKITGLFMQQQHDRIMWGMVFQPDTVNAWMQLEQITHISRTNGHMTINVFINCTL